MRNGESGGRERGQIKTVERGCAMAAPNSPAQATPDGQIPLDPFGFGRRSCRKTKKQDRTDVSEQVLVQVRGLLLFTAGISGGYGDDGGRD